MLTDDPYRDPTLYDLEYATDAEDVAYYLSLALQHANDGTVLELGCGNGRIALPIARCGVSVHGVDASEAMLDSFRAKLLREPPEVRAATQLQAGDFCALPPTALRYPLVTLPFNALHHCPSIADVERLLHGVRERLHPDGLFALDAYLPDPTLYARDPSGRYEQREFVDPATGKLLQSWEEGWWDPETRVHHVIYVYQRPSGTEDRLHLRLHMYERTELLGAFARCGFAIAAEWSDFSETAIHSDAVKWVLHLRKR
jgi:SAM-dependent methyltransferase